MRATVIRNGIIALVGGALLSRSWGGPGRFPVATLMMLWPSFGGHFLEVWFLSSVRPRLSADRAAQTGARLAVWFLGGLAFFAAIRVTAFALTGFHPWPRAPWWFGGAAFIGVELVAHLTLQLRGKPSFYNGRG
jgi:hypothetical protein